MSCTAAHLWSCSMNIVSISDMIEGFYRSWDLYNWPTSKWSATKKETRFSLNRNGITSSFLEQQFNRSTLYSIINITCIGSKNFIPYVNKILDTTLHHKVKRGILLTLSLSLSIYLSMYPFFNGFLFPTHCLTFFGIYPLSFYFIPILFLPLFLIHSSLCLNLLLSLSLSL